MTISFFGGGGGGRSISFDLRPGEEAPRRAAQVPPESHEHEVRHGLRDHGEPATRRAEYTQHVVRYMVYTRGGIALLL